MPALELSPAERKALRGQAHHLDPVVLVGSDGLTDAVRREVDGALSAHGLIKIRMFGDDRGARDAALTALADALGAAPVQHIGKLLVLWRPVPEKIKVERDDRKPGPRIVKVVKPAKRPGQRNKPERVRVLGNERVTAGGQIKRVKPRQSSVKKRAGD